MARNNNPNPLFAGLFDQFDDNAAARPASDEVAENQTKPTEPLMTNVGGQWMPVDPRALSGMNIDQNSDLQTLMRYLPQTNAGPYAANGAPNATGAVYRKQLATPYVTALAQTIGQRHPAIASLLDNGLLAMAGTQASARQNTGPYGETFGAGLSDIAAGQQYAAEAPLARRQQLENIPLSYEQQQAQLQESRAGYLQHLTTALNEYESNPAKILAQMGRNAIATSIGSASREKIAQMNNQTRLQTSLNSDETRLAVAHLQAQYRTANSQQRANLYSRFAQALDGHIGQINGRFDKLEHSQVYDTSTGLLRDRTPQEIQQLEDERQSEIGMELEYGDEVSRRAFGHNLMENAAPAPAPATPTPSKGNRSRGNSLPPAAARQLKTGQNTTFGNGQVWTLRGGKPVRVR